MSASTRASLPGGCHGGPGTSSPGIYRCGYVPMASLLSIAYSLAPYQLPPSVTSILAERYDVEAKVSPGASQEELRAMLRNLLAERFKLAVHFEKKETAIYQLMPGKSGPKLKQSAAMEPSAQKSVISMANGRWRIQIAGKGIEVLIVLLSSQVDRPIIDASGLHAKYDIDLTYAADIDAGLTVFEALQTQLGLKLESGKAPIDIVVIDHMEKTPVGN